MHAHDIEQPPRLQTGHPFAVRNTLALLAVCLAAPIFGLEISSVPVILPTLEVALHGDFSGIQWMMNAYI